MPKVPKVLAGDFWAPWHFGNPNERYQKFLQSGRPRFHRLIESVVLHESITIPTHDFMSLALLVGVLGEAATTELIESGVLRFVRMGGVLAYIGNGGGLQVIEMRSSEGVPLEPWRPMDEAIDWALKGLNVTLNTVALGRKALAISEELDLFKVGEEVRAQTHTDITQNRRLNDWLARHGSNMDRLAGIRPAEVRISAGLDSVDKADAISALLRIANANTEMLLARQTKSDDVNSAYPIADLLEAKGERIGEPPTAAERLSTLVQIAGIPNFQELVLSKQIDLGAIIKLRNSENGRQFRSWFHENCTGDAITIAREYVSLLEQVPKIRSAPARVLRFVATAALGALPVVGSLVGAVAGAVDSFGVDRWLKGNSPKFFIDDLRKLVPED